MNLSSLEDKILQLSEMHAFIQLLGKRKGQRKVLFQKDAMSSVRVNLFEKQLLCLCGHLQCQVPREKKFPLPCFCHGWTSPSVP